MKTQRHCHYRYVINMTLDVLQKMVYLVILASFVTSPERYKKKETKREKQKERERERNRKREREREREKTYENRESVWN